MILLSHISNDQRDTVVQFPTHEAVDDAITQAWKMDFTTAQGY
jgi:hypothetical protein